MRRPGAARSWSAARLALRLILARYLGEEPAAIALRLGPHGKPALAERPQRLSFNLSHSGGLVLVAVSADREVGVDVERIEAGRDLLAIAARALGPEAVAALRDSAGEERAEAFYELWVRHEARLKCGGGGLGGPAPDGPVAVSSLRVSEGYAAALAVAGADAPPLRRFSFAEP